jgi:hypothetical protein
MQIRINTDKADISAARQKRQIVAQHVDRYRYKHQADPKPPLTMQTLPIRRLIVRHNVAVLATFQPFVFFRGGHSCFDSWLFDLRLGPFPVADLRHILAVLIDVMFVFNQFVLHRLLQISSL